MDESVEQEEEVFIEPIAEEVPEISKEESGVDGGGESSEVNTDNLAPETPPPQAVPVIQNIDSAPVVTTRLTFTDYDKVIDETNKVQEINAPKTIERLEQISTSRTLQRKLDEQEDGDGEADERIRIHTEDSIDLSDFDVLDEPSGTSRPRDDSFSLDFEELV
jgi:hypothetical protein